MTAWYVRAREIADEAWLMTAHCANIRVGTTFQRTAKSGDTGMGIEIIDPKEIALRERKRTVVMNTRKLHAWVHYYPDPGDHDELHCHNEDQMFTCFEGECTMRFTD